MTNASRETSVRVLLIALLALGMTGAALAATGAISPTRVAIEETPWRVEYIDRTYDEASNTTTFTYNVTAAAGASDLASWVLEVDSDAVPLSSGGTTSYGLDDTTGLFGIEWSDGQAAASVVMYSITIDGNVAEGPVDYAVVSGSVFAVGATIGPGTTAEPPPGTFAISGTVFADSDRDGTRDAGESPLANVSVELSGSDGLAVTAVMSDALGQFSFPGLEAGGYGVSVPVSSIAADFNETLAQYYTPTVAPAPVTLGGGDSAGNDFGFALDASSILDDLIADDPDGDGTSIDGTGKTIGFWKHQNSVALAGRGRAQVDAATLQGYLDAVEELALPEPFQFDDASEFRSALAILDSTSSDELDLLRKQLLGTELNYVAGLGLTGDLQPLQAQVIAEAEYALNHPELYTREELLALKDVCDAINNSGE
ncbi:MAG: hypothetical protein H6Q01_821 [Acidobacteria bacterium]|nr:hypothetical protein [Acidobacteriota bacterium]